MTVMLEWSGLPRTCDAQTDTRLMPSAAVRLSRRPCTRAGSLLSRPRSTIVARRISSLPSAPQRSANGRRCCATPAKVAALSPHRATSGVTTAEQPAAQPVSPHIASRLSACCVKYCLSHEFASAASIGSTAKHCSVSVANSGTLASSQSAQRATIEFHRAAHRTVHIGSGPALQSAVRQHAAFNCPDASPTAAAHASSPPLPSCACTGAARMSRRPSRSRRAILAEAGRAIISPENKLCLLTRPSSRRDRCDDSHSVPWLLTATPD